MYNVKNKKINIRQNNDYILAKILGMFKYSGLPDSLPQEELEKILLQNGFAFVTKHNDELYAFSGGLGGELDAYYRPTRFIVANPWLKLNKEYEIGIEGVLVKNDSMLLGVLPLITKWNTLLVENQISMQMQSVNQRVISVFSAPDDRTKESAEQFIKKVEDGELSVVVDNAMFDGIKIHSAGQSSGRITDLIEYQQWLTSKLHTELGINDQGNMKRERLVSDEVRQSEEGLSILVDNMFIERKRAVEQINKMYGTEISVELDGIWKQKRLELDAELAINDSIIQTGGFNEELDHEQQEEKIENISEETEEEVKEVIQEVSVDYDTSDTDREISGDDQESDDISIDVTEEPVYNSIDNEADIDTTLSGDKERDEEITDEFDNTNDEESEIAEEVIEEIAEEVIEEIAEEITEIIEEELENEDN